MMRAKASMENGRTSGREHMRSKWEFNKSVLDENLTYHCLIVFKPYVSNFLGCKCLEWLHAIDAKLRIALHCIAFASFSPTGKVKAMQYLLLWKADKPHKP